MVEKLDPARFKRLSNLAEKQAMQRVGIYQQLANLTVPQIPDEEAEAETASAKK
jgi:DNA-binding phage protein